jgi:2-hydroxy-6-oxo-octa-2,4-dienoate hydrolase
MTDVVLAEVGENINAGGIRTNVLQTGAGAPVVLVHGSGPGVTAYANWRLTIPDLATRFRVIAPDMAGFGRSDKPGGYGMKLWTEQLLALLDALGLEKVSLVGNSFGGGLALRVAAEHPDRVHRMVLMGAAGVDFPITEGLDAVWGYQPSVENMRRIMDYFAYSRELVSDELAEVRYQASIQPGAQEAFSAMFPAPRQRWVQELATDEDLIREIPHETLIVHGRDDQVIPMANSARLHTLIERSELHVFGRCGHWTQIEWAAEFNQLLIRFLGRPDRQG